MKQAHEIQESLPGWRRRVEGEWRVGTDRETGPSAARMKELLTACFRVALAALLGGGTGSSSPQATGSLGKVAHSGRRVSSCRQVQNRG